MRSYQNGTYDPITNKLSGRLYEKGIALDVKIGKDLYMTIWSPVDIPLRIEYHNAPFENRK